MNAGPALALVVLLTAAPGPPSDDGLPTAQTRWYLAYSRATTFNMGDLRLSRSRATFHHLRGELRLRRVGAQTSIVEPTEGQLYQVLNGEAFLRRNHGPYHRICDQPLRWIVVSRAGTSLIRIEFHAGPPGEPATEANLCRADTFLYS